MNYEIQQAIDRKADKWELHNLQNENGQLKRDLKQLEKEIGELRAKQNNSYEAINNLIELISEHDCFVNDLDILYNIKTGL